MARVTENGFAGTVGNLVFYSMNGKSYVRTKPGPRKKNKGAVQNPLNTVFGIVSKHGSALIKGINSEFPFRFGREAYNNVRGWMRNNYSMYKDAADWELSVRASGMCQLNKETDLRDCLKVELSVTDEGNGKIAITFPSIIPVRDIKAPSRTMKVNIKLIVVTSPFRNAPGTYNHCTEQFSFIYNDSELPAKTFLIETKASKPDLVFTAVSLTYETKDSGEAKYNTEKKWLPAAMIAMGRLK